jgi:hypothetical protein
MIAYIYNKEGKFTGSCVAPVNPRNLSKFLMPVDSTDIQPPKDHSINEWPMFNEDTQTWSLVESDYKIQKDIEDQELIDQQNEEAQNIENQRIKEVNETGILINEIIDDVIVARDSLTVIAETNKVVGSISLSNLHIKCESDILDYAKNITKGSTKDSIQAFIQAYQLRANNPSEYINQGLKVYYETPDYPLYTLLDNELAITEYYTTILVDIDKQRETIIEQYLIDKAQALVDYPEVLDDSIVPKFPTE